MKKQTTIMPTDEQMNLLMAERAPDEQMITAGMNYNVAETDYHRMFAFSNSGAGMMKDATPAHFRHWQLYGESRTSDAKLRGSATHALLFTPDEFARRYRIGPDKGRNTVDWKDWASQYEHLPDLILIKESEGRKICAMREKVLANTRARRIIENVTDYESTGIVIEPSTGSLCKFRPDILCPGIGSDLKTARSAHPRDFRKAVEDYHYHRQIATYWHLSALLGIEIDRYYVIVVENESPFECAVYEIDPVDLVSGWDEFRAQAERFTECVVSGIWPGYDEQITTISRGRWARERD